MLIRSTVSNDIAAVLDADTREAWLTECGVGLRALQVVLHWTRTGEIFDNRDLAVRIIKANTASLRILEDLCVCLGNPATVERIRTLKALATAA